MTRTDNQNMSARLAEGAHANPSYSQSSAVVAACLFAFAALLDQLTHLFAEAEAEDREDKKRKDAACR